jgi:hypothetical protein
LGDVPNRERGECWSNNFAAMGKMDGKICERSDPYGAKEEEFKKWFLEEGACFRKFQE